MWQEQRIPRYAWATLVLVLVFMVPEMAWGSDRFGDVPSNHVFHDDISWLAESGVTRGCNPPASTMFCPDDPVTRGQMAAFLVRALDLPAGNARFSDTAGGHVFADDIGALASAGITRGCNPPANDRFCPDEVVTRGQMAAFLVRALKLQAAEAFFADTIGTTFEADVAALADVGVTRGCDPPANYDFCPDEPVTRAQMAAFLMRALEGDLSSGQGQTVSEAALAFFHSMRSTCNSPADPLRWVSPSVIRVLDPGRVLIADGLGFRLIVDFWYRPPVAYPEGGPAAVLPIDLSFGCPPDVLLGSHHD